MIELDFTVPPQILAGSHVVGVQVSASPTIFPDHDAFVSIKLTADYGKTVLAEESRVPRSEAAIDRWLDEQGRAVERRLDREDARRQKALRR